jgi:hypothetical protein
MYRILPVVLFFIMSFSTTTTTDVRTITPTKLIAAETRITFEEEVASIYSKLNTQNLALPKLQSFTKALEGYYKLKAKGLVTKEILTLVDFSLSSNTKRLWIIDMSTNTILYNTLVAHGRNTGDEYANSFSNTGESFKSSLGFYTTGEVYNGKHGMSMKLDGLEPGVNNNARNRAVVMHGADYVSDSFIKNHSRLGRSLGCPAIPVEMTPEIINTIKNKSCLFIYHPSRDSKPASKLLS